MALLASRETIMNLSPPTHEDDYDGDELSSSCWLDLA